MIDVLAPVDFSCSRGKKFAAIKIQFLIFLFEKNVAKKWARFFGKKDRKREATPDYEKSKKTASPNLVWVNLWYQAVLSVGAAWFS